MLRLRFRDERRINTIYSAIEARNNETKNNQRFYQNAY